MEGVTVRHIMADGTECKDLSHYLDNHKLPEAVIQLLRNMILQEQCVTGREANE